MEPSRDLAHAVNSTTTIPSDLIFEILSFLPAKSLIRFQYVSKLWFSIIRSKNFVDSFMAMSKTRPRLLLHLKHNETGKSFIFSAPEHNSIFSAPEHNNDHDKSSSRVIARHDMTMPDPVHQIKSVPIDGLICFISDSSSISVCNPTTRQIVKLPDVTPNGSNMHVHLGYDPVENQYKVLRVMVFNVNGKIQHEHFICTVRSSPKQEWRKIENITGDGYPINGGVCINGAIFFFFFFLSLKRSINGAIYYVIGQSRIVRFDVRSEKMVQLIKAPEESAFCLRKFISYLTNYNGKLGGVIDAYSKDVRLWILENVEKHEWSSMTFALPSVLEYLPVISMKFKGVIRSGEPMVLHLWLGACVSIRDVEIQGVADGDLRRIHGIGDNGDLTGDISSYPGYIENIRFL